MNEIFDQMVKLIRKRSKREPEPVKEPELFLDEGQFMRATFGLSSLCIFVSVFSIVADGIKGFHGIGTIIQRVRGLYHRTVTRRHRFPLPPRKLIRDSLYYPAVNEWAKYRLAYATSYQGVHIIGARKYHKG